MDFETWMEGVDNIFESTFGLRSTDFEDWNWLNAFDSGATCEQAFADWNAENGYGII